MVEVNLENLVSKMNAVGKTALEDALGMVINYGQEAAEIEHWLYQLLLLQDAELLEILARFEVSVAALEKSLLHAIESFSKKNTSVPTISQSLIDLLNKSWQVASIEYNQNTLSAGFILSTLLSDMLLAQKALQVAPVLKKIDLLQLKQMLREMPLISEANPEPVNQQKVQEGLAKYTVDLVAEAKQKKIDQVIGREAEIRQMIDILMRRRQNNPILTGEPGVGKTAIVEGLALRIAENNVPDHLLNVKIHALDLGLLQAGASVKGEFERRLKDLLKDIENSADPIILFIDEAHTLIGAGGAVGQMDAANILKPALARGMLRVIAATTWSEYKQYIESDAALTRRFQVVNVKEPDEETATYMLRSMVGKLEQHHGVKILSEAVESAVVFAKRYLTERQLPDSAISVLDTACARVADQQNDLPVLVTNLQERQRNLLLEMQQLSTEDTSPQKRQRIKKLKSLIAIVDKSISKNLTAYNSEQKIAQDILRLQNMVELTEFEQDDLNDLKKQLINQQRQQQFIHLFVDKNIVAQVIANWTGIPVENMLRGAEDCLLSLENKLKERIVGQKQSLNIISNKLLSAGAKLMAPNKPTGVFLLVGPSGVGKTETAHVLAEELFGSRTKMTVINMSEFKEAHKVSTLTGSPPGYVGYGKGGVLTEAIRREPYSLILLDEMEKAHPSVQELFFQMFDKGELRDSEGRVVDCKNTLIVMTSNAGSEFIIDKSEDQNLDIESFTFKYELNEVLSKIFSPAFLGRTTIVPYLPLGDAELNGIISRELQLLNNRAHSNYNINLEFNNNVNAYLVNQCIQKSFGARQIYNSISQQLLPIVSEKLLHMVSKKRRANKLTVSRQEDEWLVI